MRNKFIGAVLLLSVFVAGSMLASDSKTITPANSLYLANCDSFLNVMQRFYDAVGSSTDIADWKAGYAAGRTAYKKISLIIELRDPQLSKWMNGPNLPYPAYPDDDIISGIVSEAHGFQTIEEMLYSGEEIDSRTLQNEIKMLQAHTRSWKQLVTANPINDAEWVAAFKQELVYVYCLGLTGFDSPISLQSITESIDALAASKQYFEVFAGYTTNKQHIIKAYNAGISYLKTHKDFDELDRAAYYKTYIQPLYAGLIDWQRENHIESVMESGVMRPAVNDTVKHFFSNHFINATYYAMGQYRLDKELEQKQAALGELLFYDPVLSLHADRSCASCHNPQLAFAENIKTSKGINSMLLRNAPSLSYAALQSMQFWDARADKPESQPEHVILNPEEFGATYELIYQRLLQSDAYKAMFRDAFPKSASAITGGNMGAALAAYLRTLPAFSSPFDKYMRGESNQLDEQAIAGYNLFMGKAKCGTCHFAPVFSGTVPPDYFETETEVLGITATEDLAHPALDEDLGRGPVAHLPMYNHSFKTPTARNTEYTMPYMHNGAFNSLDSLLAFYNYGGGTGLGLDVPNQTLPPDSLHLNTKEISQLKAFLVSIDDAKPSKNYLPARLPYISGDSLMVRRRPGGMY